MKAEKFALIEKALQDLRGGKLMTSRARMKAT